MSTIDMFNGTAPGAPSLAEQLQRLPPTDRVWVDALLEHGATLEAFEDSTVERHRLSAVKLDHLRSMWILRFRGKRRAWSMPVLKADERPWRARDANGVQWRHLHYEPRLERPLGGWPRKETEHQSGKRRHWPTTSPTQHNQGAP